MVSRLEQMKSSMMNDLMKDVMLSLSGVPPERPTPSNKLISSDGRVQTIGGLQAADLLTVNIAFLYIYIIIIIIVIINV